MFRILFTFENHEPLSLVSYQFNTMEELEQRLHDPLPLVFQTSEGPVILDHDDFDIVYVQKLGPTGVFESAQILNVGKRGSTQTNKEIDAMTQDMTIDEPILTKEGKIVSDESEVVSLTEVDGSDVATSEHVQLDEPVTAPIETASTEDVKIDAVEKATSDESAISEVDTQSIKEEVVSEEKSDVVGTIAPASEVFVGFCEKFLGSKARAEGWEAKIIEKQLEYERDLEETYNVLDARADMVVAFKESIVGK